MLSHLQGTGPLDTIAPEIGRHGHAIRAAAPTTHHHAGGGTRTARPSRAAMAAKPARASIALGAWRKSTGPRLAPRLRPMGAVSPAVTPPVSRGRSRVPSLCAGNTPVRGHLLAVLDGAEVIQPSCSGAVSPAVTTIISEVAVVDRPTTGLLTGSAIRSSATGASTPAFARDLSISIWLWLTFAGVHPLCRAPLDPSGVNPSQPMPSRAVAYPRQNCRPRRVLPDRQGRAPEQGLGTHPPRRNP
jgi:hypothetical protein